MAVPRNQMIAAFTWFGPWLLAALLAVYAALAKG